MRNDIVLDNPLAICIWNGTLKTITDLDGNLSAGRLCLRFYEEHDTIVEVFGADSPSYTYLGGKLGRLISVQVRNRNDSNLIGRRIIECNQFLLK